MSRKVIPVVACKDLEAEVQVLQHRLDKLKPLDTRLGRRIC